MKQDNDPGRIDQFIDKSFRFRQDEVFHPVEVFERYEDQLSLAASGGQQTPGVGQRVGLLTNLNESIVLRVFQDRTTEDYQLFPAGDPGRDLTGSIVSDQETLQFFNVRDDYIIFIPKSSGLNPMTARLQLTYPDDIYEFNLSKEIEQSPQHIQCKDKAGITVRFIQGAMDGNLLEFTLSNFEKTPGKVLFRQNKYAWMIPVRNERAVVSMPEWSSEKIRLYLYE